MGRAPCCSKIGLNRGPWSIEEDKLLIHYIQTHGEGHWRSLPSKAGLLRCGKSCRLRWVNYLRPGVKRGNFTSDENDTIIRLHSLHGNRWSLIAAEFPGRTDNEIKNHWNTHLRKKALLAAAAQSDHDHPLDNNSTCQPVVESKSSSDEDDDRINITTNNVTCYENFESSQELENVGDNGNSTEEGIKVEALENGGGATPTSSGTTSYSSSSSTVITSTDHQGEVNMNMNVATDTFFYELDDFIDVDQEMKSSSSSSSCCCRDIMEDGTKALERVYMEYLQLLNYGAAAEC